MHCSLCSCVCFASNLLSSPTPPPSSDVLVLATQIWSRFLNPDAPTEFLSESTEDQRGMIADQIQMGTPIIGMFDQVRNTSIAILNSEFAEFKRTPEYASLNEGLSKNVVEDKREIEQFEGERIIPYSNDHIFASRYFTSIV